MSSLDIFYVFTYFCIAFNSFLLIHFQENFTENLKKYDFNDDGWKDFYDQMAKVIPNLRESIDEKKKIIESLRIIHEKEEVKTFKDIIHLFEIFSTSKPDYRPEPSPV